MVRIAGTASRRWDDLTAVIAQIRTGDGPGLVLVDDLDVAFRDWPDDHRHAAYDMVETILREGRRRGVSVAATAGSAHRLGAGIREGFGQTVLLRHPNRSDLVQAGGAGRLWRDDDPPGSGQWRGRRVQFLDAAPARSHPPMPPAQLELDPAGFTAIVTASPRTDAAALRALGHEPVLLEPAGDAAARVAVAARDRAAGTALLVVGDADAWLANWALTRQAREDAVIIVHGDRREYRVFATGTEVPPLLDDALSQCWVLTHGDPPLRATWPHPPNN